MRKESVNGREGRRTNKERWMNGRERSGSEEGKQREQDG